MGKPKPTFIYLLLLVLVFASNPTKTSAQSNDPFYKELRQQGRSSFTGQEYDDFIKSHMDEYIEATFEEIRILSEKILSLYNPKDYFYIDIGAGPTPIAAYLGNRASVHRANLPLSGFQDAVDERGVFIMNPLPGQNRIIPEAEYLKILKEHFDRFIPREALTVNKKVLIIDTVQEGRTLLNAHRRISDYLHHFNPTQEVEALGLLHPGAKPITSRPSLLTETEEQVAVRLKKFQFFSLNNSLLGKLLFGRNLQDFSEHSRFEPGREVSSEVKFNPKFKIISEKMKIKMETAGVLVQKTWTCGDSRQFLKQVFAEELKHAP